MPCNDSSVIVGGFFLCCWCFFSLLLVFSPTTFPLLLVFSPTTYLLIHLSTTKRSSIPVIKRRFTISNYSFVLKVCATRQQKFFFCGFQ